MGHPRYRAPVKRALDLAIAIPALIAVLPLGGLLALAILVTMGPPVIFRQERSGRGGRPFRIFKFRTMTQARDPEGRLLPDEHRLTRLGKWLRATTLDELPELLNVLSGEMSIVGPRPFLSSYIAYYTPQEARRLEVKPGLTGWAVVQGRNSLSWEERLRLDAWYVENASLTLDCAIMLKTALIILRRDGVNAKGHVTMPRLDEEREQRIPTHPAKRR